MGSRRRLDWRSVRAWGLHLGRWIVFAVILWLIRDQHAWRIAQEEGGRRARILLDQVLPFFPNAGGLSAFDRSHGGQNVTDSGGRPLGYVIQTSPDSDGIIGYSGPTNTLVAFDTNDQILGFDVLSSGDTRDHLQAVLDDHRFRGALRGLGWEQARALRAVDGVSGATLTSLAIIEGIGRRLGGMPHSYRFPEAITVDEVQRYFPTADWLLASEGRPGWLQVLAADGTVLGGVTRTSPTADDIIGFQGPTDTLVVFDPQENVQGLAIRDTFETEDYADWVRDDEYFLGALNGRSLDELAELDLSAAGIEGVSGATMTSQCMVDGVLRTASRLSQEEAVQPSRKLQLSAPDAGTALIIVFGLLMGFSSLRSRRVVRIGFQLVLIAYLGFLHGEMVSQAVLVGWTQSGVAWRSATGLVLLVAAALLVPLAARKQVYCHHLCPHGAAQQLVRKWLPWRLHLPPWSTRLLSLFPWLLLGWVLVVAMIGLPYNLAAIEPFDAYLFRIAGWSSLAIAVGGLAVSLFVPMAYCRFGCPTGAMLNFLRRHGRGDRFTRRDMAALGLLILAVGLVGWQRWL